MCSTTLGSPTSGPKQLFRACRRRVVCAVYGYGYGRDGYTGGYGGGLYWVLPSQLLEGGPTDSEAGPVGPARAGVGGLWGRNARCTTLRARSGTRALPVHLPAECRLLANKGEINVLFTES